MTKYYADVKAKPDFVALEKEVLKFWEEDKTFEKSVHNRDGAAEFAPLYQCWYSARGA